jgi:hypothetical protein
MIIDILLVFHENHQFFDAFEIIETPYGLVVDESQLNHQCSTLVTYHVNCLVC